MNTAVMNVAHMDQFTNPMMMRLPGLTVLNVIYR